MAISYSVPGLPSAAGSTIIQSNNLVIPGVYEKIADDTRAQVVSRWGGEGRLIHYKTTPLKNTTELWTMRNNLALATGEMGTLVRQRVTRFTSSVAPATVPSGLSDKGVPQVSALIEVHAWTPIIRTESDGRTYLLVSLHGDLGQLWFNAETGNWEEPTNGYQLKYQATNFMYKPVAGGAPLLDPALKAMLGRIPV